MNQQHLKRDLALIRAKSPLVHNITNYVAMNFSANALLARGASPVMAHAVEEIEDIDESAEDVDLGGELDNELDAEDIMGGEIKADPAVDYSQKGESDEGFTVAQLDLF